MLLYSSRNFGIPIGSSLKFSKGGLHLLEEAFVFSHDRLVFWSVHLYGGRRICFRDGRFSIQHNPDDTRDPRRRPLLAHATFNLYSAAPAVLSTFSKSTVPHHRLDDPVLCLLIHSKISFHIFFLKKRLCASVCVCGLLAMTWLCSVAIGQWQWGDGYILYWLLIRLIMIVFQVDIEEDIIFPMSEVQCCWNFWKNDLKKRLDSYHHNPPRRTTMGKKGSKLKQETIDSLTHDTYCKSFLVKKYKAVLIYYSFVWPSTTRRNIS